VRQRPFRRTAALDQGGKHEPFKTTQKFVSCLGPSFGALGASFQQQHYFRHMAFVDEEL
jgi:hypothetical protein